MVMSGCARAKDGVVKALVNKTKRIAHLNLNIFHSCERWSVKARTALGYVICLFTCGSLIPVVRVGGRPGVSPPGAARLSSRLELRSCAKNHGIAHFRPSCRLDIVNKLSNVLGGCLWMFSCRFSIAFCKIYKRIFQGPVEL